MSIDDIYTKFKSLSFHKNFSNFISTNPHKFLRILKANNDYPNLSRETQNKIFNKVCEMIKSINPDVITLGLKILKQIIPYVPEEYFENSFTYNQTLSENNSGIFACALEEKKEIKIKVLKLITQYSDRIHTEKNFDFVLELINDEEDEVRVFTVDCLKVLLKKVDFVSFKACSIVLFALNEAQPKIRRKFMELLSKMKVCIDKENFNQVINVLNSNIKIFPADRLYIFKCVKDFTELNYTCLNEKYFTNCFKIDESFLIVGYSWEEDKYIIDMIIFQEFIYHKQFDLTMLIPNFFVKHFFYFEQKFPEIFDRNISAYFHSLLSKSGKNLDFKDNQMQIDDFGAPSLINYNEFSNEEISKLFSSVLTGNDNKFTYEKTYAAIEAAFRNNYPNPAHVIGVLSMINFQLSIEITDAEQSKHLIAANETLIASIQGRVPLSSLDEETYKKSKEYFKEKKIVSLKIFHPEDFQIYSDANRADKVFPFSLQISLKFKNIGKINPRPEIILTKMIKLTINELDDRVFHEVSLNLAKDTSFSFLSNKHISIKSKELLFVPNSKKLLQLKFKVYINHFEINSTHFNIQN